MSLKKKVVMMVILPAVLYGTLVEAAKLYKVVDQYGNVSYQSRPAPLDPGVISEEKTFDTKEGKGGSSLSVIALRNPVVIYTAPNCNSCDQARELLNKLKIPYTDKNAQANTEVGKELKKVSGALTVPVITIGEKVIQGFARPWLESELLKAGYPVPKQQSSAPAP